MKTLNSKNNLLFQHLGSLTKCYEVDTTYDAELLEQKLQESLETLSSTLDLVFELYRGNKEGKDTVNVEMIWKQ